MSTPVTDEQIRDLAATARPFSIALLHWTDQRHQDGAEATEPGAPATDGVAARGRHHRRTEPGAVGHARGRRDPHAQRRRGARA
ncbi:hypothetical protein [Nocardioides convexus]|uniref:hypothetical protein n=1 Tax=Nocardioides convexus TaxID=2712224 RepID=UPI002418A577|nr:hypothetical protein [Nocardioides convexus]